MFIVSLVFLVADKPIKPDLTQPIRFLYILTLTYPNPTLLVSVPCVVS